MCNKFQYLDSSHAASGVPQIRQEYADVQQIPVVQAVAMRQAGVKNQTGSVDVQQNPVIRFPYPTNEARALTSVQVEVPICRSGQFIIAPNTEVEWQFPLGTLIMAPG